MSATLTYSIIPESKSLPFELKQILQSRYSFPMTIDYSHIQYLSALADVHIKGAQQLIDVIEKYGQVELKLEY